MQNKPMIGVDLEGKRLRVGRVVQGKIEAHNSAYISYEAGNLMKQATASNMG
jgi:hypothetical protein